MIYVGVHKTDGEGFDGYFGSNLHLRRAIEKHGSEKFIRETLFDNLDKEQAYDLESTIVDENFISRKDVYNEKCGGFGGSNPGREFHQSDDFKKKLSDGVKKYIQELSQVGIPHHNAGRRASLETRDKMSKSHTGKHTGELNHMYSISYEDHPKGMLGKTHTQETKEKISKSGKERYEEHPPYVRTEEIKRKISEAKRGSIAWNKGISPSEEVKQKMRKPRLERICPHCQKIGRGGNMIRYHFDNCKDAPC